MSTFERNMNHFSTQLWALVATTMLYFAVFFYTERGRRMKERVKKKEKEKEIDESDVTKLKPSWKSIFRALCQRKLIRLYCNRIQNSIVYIHTKYKHTFTFTFTYTYTHTKEKLFENTHTLARIYRYSRWNDSNLTCSVYGISSGDCFSSLICLFVCYFKLTQCTLLQGKLEFPFDYVMYWNDTSVFHIETTTTFICPHTRIKQGNAHIHIAAQSCQKETQFTCAWISKACYC